MAPTTLADGSALRKTWRALPTREGVPALRGPEALVAGIVEAVFEPEYAVEQLGHVGGRGLDQVAARGAVESEQQKLQLR